MDIETVVVVGSVCVQSSNTKTDSITHRQTVSHTDRQYHTQT